jgi:hypothetical protein
VATDKMNNDSVVSLGGLGGGHIDKRGLKKRAQAVDDFILAAGTRETHAVPKYERGSNGLNREVQESSSRIRTLAGLKKAAW